MHSYEEYNKPIQELIKIMKDDYPNGFVLQVNSIGAELINNQTVLSFIDEKLMSSCLSNVMSSKAMKNCLKKDKKPID